MPRKSKPTQPAAPTPPTPEQVKSLIDAQDWAWQQTLWLRCIEDPQSVIGRNVLSLIAALWDHIERLEAEAGLALGEIDPEGLLDKRETLKEAAGRLGKNTNAVKQSRHRAKERMDKLRHTTPGVVTQGGRVVEVTEIP